jgi:hypothetical protein
VLDQVTATRYVTPLREGGSLPGIVEADDLGTYVVKFRGAGQGLRVLVAEVIVGELARRLGIRVPDLVAVELDAQIAKYEADEEVQDLLTASLGLNLGSDFLPGAFGYDANCRLDPEEAAAILWLDAYVANVDRSWRNPNLLVWHGRPWLIDHGASLYFHHSWAGGLGDPQRFANQPWDMTGHVFADQVDSLSEIDPGFRDALAADVLAGIVGDVPEEWLAQVPGATTDQQRAAYVEFLTARVGSRAWLPIRRAS